MKARPLPPAAYLRECFDYDATTGVLTWRTRPLRHFKSSAAHASANARFAGKATGCPCTKGALQVVINRRLLLVHRVIWCMQTGKWAAEIDHLDRDKTNNRWSNLREVTSQQNQWNRSRSGPLPRGVGRNKNRYQATLQSRKSGSRYLGSFATPEEAHEAWCAAAAKERGEFFHPG